MYPKIEVLSTKTGGQINLNKSFLAHLPSGSLIRSLIKSSEKGTPILKFGSGSPRIMIVSGVHGNELPPQIASMELIMELERLKGQGTVYVIPFAIPYATMDNNRRYEGMDMNRRANVEGSISNNIIKKLDILKIDSMADFHSTQKRSNPGVECVFCSKKPLSESLKIASHITKKTSSKVIVHESAGTLYKGALEDESNIRGVPAVTCEVVSSNGNVDTGSSKRSLLQMKAYLEYFNILI